MLFSFFFCASLLFAATRTGGADERRGAREESRGRGMVMVFF